MNTNGVVVSGVTRQKVSGEIDFGRIFRLIRVRWKSVVLSAIAGGAVGFLISFAYTPMFRADALLIKSADPEGSAQAGALSGQLGGLASLAGISPGSIGQRQNEAIATLKSRSLIESYIKDENLLPVLFSWRWDESAGRWRWSSFLKEPSLWEGYSLFQKHLLKIAEDKKTGLVTVSIEWKNPQAAAKWVNDLINRTNASLRQQAIERSNRNLAYLDEQLQKTTIVELRNAIYKLVESEVKNVMVAQGDEYYAYRFVDQAEVPEKKTSPMRLAYFLVGFLLAAIASGWRAYVLGCRPQPE